VVRQGTADFPDLVVFVRLVRGGEKPVGRTAQRVGGGGRRGPLVAVVEAAWRIAPTGVFAAQADRVRRGRSRPRRRAFHLHPARSRQFPARRASWSPPGHSAQHRCHAHERGIHRCRLHPQHCHRRGDALRAGLSRRSGAADPAHDPHAVQPQPQRRVVLRGHGTG